MKSFLVIGTGHFGSHLCHYLAELGNELMVIDMNEEALESVLPYAIEAKIGDCTKEVVLKSLGVKNFDKCFVCMGSDFQSSLVITSMLKELGAKYVIAKADREVHVKFLLRNGADEVIFPDCEIAEKSAIMYSSDSIFDYFNLAEDFAMYELAPLPEWIGKTLDEVNVAETYNVNIVAVSTAGTVSMVPSGYKFAEEDHLMVIGRNEDIGKITRHYKN